MSPTIQLERARQTFGTATSLPTAAARTRRSGASALVVAPEDALVGELILIDSRHPVSEAARRVRLAAPFEAQPDVLLARAAATALRQAVSELGFERRVGAVSGFRTREVQKELWDRFAAADEAQAPCVAAPGASEHEAGLAVDLCRLWPLTGRRRLGFPHTGVCQRLREALPHFGFVERYPAGREDVTGIAGEPWHFRYVGTPHALAMTRLGLTLEEWLSLLAREAPIARPLAISAEGEVTPCPRHSAPAGSTLVAHAPVEGAYAVSLPHARGAAFAHVSGTNAGGVVITWPAA